ncbi:MAG: succinate dehydrogenase, cytochrome b556 subunit [Asticcacaulis sp.]
MSPTPHRPLSPHLQIWRWHFTMFSSIMHRVTGSGNVAGLLLVTAWLVSLAMGREAYTGFLSLAASPIGLILWFLLSLSAFVHIMGGIRHFIWDLGLSLEPKAADTLVYITMILAVVLDLAFWVYLILSQKVVL